MSDRRAEAGALLEHPVSAAEAASELGSLCSLAAITDGANGSCISALGRLQVRLLLHLATANCHFKRTVRAYCQLMILGRLTDVSTYYCLCRLQVVPPYWTTDAPVDTCGAGDAYCAGLLYAYLSGMDLASMGRCSARTASAVISRSGACLSTQEAERVVASMPPADGYRAHFAGLALQPTAATTL